MPSQERVEKLQQLESALGCAVIAYVTSTRPNAEAQMGMDAIRFVYEHLRVLSPRPDKLALLIHSNGGDGTVPWKLVTLLREYCKELLVLVPFRAFSAATLTALGASQIYLHPMGMLGPTDPSITGPHNPRDPQNPAVPLPISVEEVLAYFSLIREDAGINHEDQVIQAVTKLADHVHPIALGSVKRSHLQSRMMAKKLLEIGQPSLDEHRIKEIVANLTSRLYFHGHPINRTEAKQIGLQIHDCSADIEDAMWALYEEYERDFEMLTPFNAAHLFHASTPSLPANTVGTHDLSPLYMVMVESSTRCDALSMDARIVGQRDANGGVQTQTLINRQSWQRVR